MENKKKKTILIVIISLAAILLAIGCHYGYYMLNKKNSKKDVEVKEKQVEELKENTKQIETETGKEEKTTQSFSKTCTRDEKANQSTCDINGYVFIIKTIEENPEDIDTWYYQIFNKDGKQIGNNIPYDPDPLLNDHAFNGDGTVTFRKSIISTNEKMSISDNNVFSYIVYDYNNNVIIENDKLNVVNIVDNYLMVVKDNHIRLADYKGNFIKEVDFDLNSGNYTFIPALSGWFTDQGKNGIFFVIENNDLEPGTSSNGIEYYYEPTTGQTGTILTEVGGYAKPVLYLYPTEKANITVSFTKPQLLTTTYPKYSKIWQVTAYPNGDLYDANNNYYYGLYWEEAGSTAVDFKTGFYVTKENAIKFLEEKLSIIGLNAKERNEFIMYWLPILEKNNKSLVYFELTEERENYNKLNIKPVPDSLLRLAIHVKKVDKKVNIKEEKLTTFKRVGFAAVEWGGVIH